MTTDYGTDYGPPSSGLSAYVATEAESIDSPELQNSGSGLSLCTLWKPTKNPFQPIVKLVCSSVPALRVQMTDGLLAMSTA
ncbi:hypothetical protein H072_7524 [Dactylellina haptotyla CBS 200.50]|uniref:Uncharacterized protein n=1 Tax=Dactylellina haptotyla (strain CBS 200.50) TaxID=1284197 RepID=S8BTU1_DACHA|nr:hypothetical protein H072_7524 [Dactylellina haptotyla CBS 200.50]